MGCSTSKLDDLPAVALCRERCAFLDEAIHLRYALAEAHLSYICSLKSIGHSLNNFIEEGFVDSSGSSSSPKLNLPSHRKGDPVVIETSKSPPHHLSHSNSDSHLHFHSDSDDESGSLHHSDHSSPLHQSHAGQLDYMGSDQEGLGSHPGGFMHMNYMKNKTLPSVVYEQRVMSPEKVYHMGESSSSAGYYHDSHRYPNMNPNSYPFYGYPNYGRGGSNGFYSSSPPVAPAMSAEPPPPPPPPPTASAWDFLNLFESNDKYNSAYAPSRDSKEVRDEEGIPDLEDEGYQHEVVKELYGDNNFVDNGNNSRSVVDDEVVKSDIEVENYQTSASDEVKDERMEYDVHVVDKKVFDDVEKSKDLGKGAGSRDVSDIAREIKIQFERASESGNEIAKMLEVGKLPYQRKYGAVSSKMLLPVTPSLSVASSSSQPSTSKSGESSSSMTDETGSTEMGFVEDMGMRSGNLSSTLQKLYLWEKKLYNEVEAEEKMRVILDRKFRKLKRLDERGADAHKVEATQTLIRSLSTKIRIVIQVVDKISVTINKIRDDELWPQLDELVQGLTKMWKCMLECHRTQCQAFREARSLGSIGSGKKHSQAHFAGTLQLQHEVINWTLKFSNWISAQKGYVRALNNWLLKCLLYEPEETADGIAPFSPGRMGAPLVFIICNEWSQSLDRISEKEVIDSMRVFTMSLLQIWEHDKLEMRQRMTANKDLERKVKNLDRENQKIQKELQLLDKTTVMISGDANSSLSASGRVVYQSDTSSTSLQAGLLCIFEAMERFTADSMKAYEGLLQRSEEEKLNQQHGTVS